MQHQITCKLCDKNFSSKECLNLHIKTKSCSNKVKIKKEFKCEYCEKILSTKQMLKYHTESCDKQKIFCIKTEYDTMIKEITNDFSSKEKEYLNKISLLESKLNYLNNSQTYINLSDFIVPLNSIKQQILSEDDITPSCSTKSSLNKSVFNSESTLETKLNNNIKTNLENPLFKRRVSF